MAVVEPGLGAHVGHVDHLNHDCQHGHEAQQNEGGTSAGGLWSVPVELLQWVHQAGGKGETQCLEVYCHHL